VSSLLIVKDIAQTVFRCAEENEQCEYQYGGSQAKTQSISGILLQSVSSPCTKFSRTHAWQRSYRKARDIIDITGHASVPYNMADIFSKFKTTSSEAW